MQTSVDNENEEYVEINRYTIHIILLILISLVILNH